MEKSNIILIGMSGTMKSSAGKIAAKKTNRLFLDSDKRFEENFGSIAKFFDTYGEAAFRLEESKILYEFAGKENAVIACGGGAVLSPAISYLKASGKIILLAASEQTLFNRLKNDTFRPLLRGDMKSKIAALMKDRAPLYRKYADKVIFTDDLTADEIADTVIKSL